MVFFVSAFVYIKERETTIGITSVVTVQSDYGCRCRTPIHITQSVLTNVKSIRRLCQPLHRSAVHHAHAIKLSMSFIYTLKRFFNWPPSF